MLHSNIGHYRALFHILLFCSKKSKTIKQINVKIMLPPTAGMQTHNISHVKRHLQ